LSSSTRIDAKETRITHCFCHHRFSLNPFRKIKSLFNEGKQVDVICEYFKNLNPFAVSFLNVMQNENDMAVV
jgi:hypothetical protein